MERYDFDQELARRRISGYTEEMLEEDLDNLSNLPAR